MVAPHNTNGGEKALPPSQKMGRGDQKESIFELVAELNLSLACSLGISMHTAHRVVQHQDRGLSQLDFGMLPC